MRNRAFTLIELLVVIGIIALLASIMLPVFKTVMERAHMTQDASNLRQIGIGFTAYFNDHDDTIMTTGTWPALVGPGSSGNYVSDWHVFQSPFDRRVFSTNSPQNVSYGMNDNILTLTNTNTTVTSYHYPSALMLLGPADSKSGSGLSFANSSTTNTTKVLPGSGIVGLAGNYTLLNVLCLDGHVMQGMKASDFNTTNYNANTTGQSEFWNPLAD